MKLKLTKLIASTIALAIMSTVAIAEDGKEKKGKKKGKGKPAAERPERPEPVSYTHLTLPTNREV